MKPLEEAGSTLMHKLLMAGSAGAGTVLAYAAWSLAKLAPQQMLAVLGSWGPLAVILMTGMVMADRRFGQVLDVQRENTTAQQQLADAVNRIAERDDERERELDLVMGKLARDTSEILERMKALEQSGQSHGAHAG